MFTIINIINRLIIVFKVELLYKEYHRKTLLPPTLIPDRLHDLKRWIIDPKSPTTWIRTNKLFVIKLLFICIYLRVTLMG